jgi:hypothetical protein
MMSELAGFAIRDLWGCAGYVIQSSSGSGLRFVDRVRRIKGLIFMTPFALIESGIISITYDSQGAALSGTITTRLERKLLAGRGGGRIEDNITLS